jgi:hypothetical protein
LRSAKVTGAATYRYCCSGKDGSAKKCHGSKPFE